METAKDNLINFKQYTEKHVPDIEIALREFLPTSPPKIEAEFNSALESVLFSDKVRLRSILTLLGSELFGGKPDDVLPASVAVEYIFASLQVFHKSKYFANRQKVIVNEIGDDGLLTLVALGCLNAAYPLVFVNHIGMPDRAMQAHREIVECVGASGLIGDLANSRAVFKDELANELAESTVASDLGTPAQIRLALRLGAILAGADYLDLANLSRVAEIIGRTFLISNSLAENEDLSVNSSALEAELNNLIDEAKRLLIENFPSNEARSCLIQLVESLTEY
jgi:hypothetical protein